MAHPPAFAGASASLWAALRGPSGHFRQPEDLELGTSGMGLIDALIRKPRGADLSASSNEKPCTDVQAAGQLAEAL